MYGWAGKVLRVNLSTREIDKEPLNQEWAQDFIGGRGLNIRTLYDEVTSETDPMSPENPLIIGVGPCNGTLVAGSSRLTVTTKSPLTGFLGDASTGATFGAELKYAGYDQIIIRGKSDKPVYLWIEDDKVEIRDAAHLWGKNVVPTISSLEQECKAPGIGLLCIGPAGENLVRFATIMGPMGRAAGRTGVGTVMGSKKLKAMVVKGSQGVKVAHPERLEETFREMRRVWLEDRKEDYERKVKYGLNELLWAYRRLDIASVRNYQGGEFEGWDNYDPKLL
ncbi:MAG: aldehyde ferredoxin oxidoreductase N-terminal domain-containing protein, partial [Chloroflexota bacterium]